MAKKFYVLRDLTPNRGTVIYFGPSRAEAQLIADTVPGSRVFPAHRRNSDYPVQPRAYHRDGVAWVILRTDRAAYPAQRMGR